MQKAIIHTTTRIVRRLTTDDKPEIAVDESIVELTEPIDLAGGFWKLDSDNKKTQAMDIEVALSGVDEEKIISDKLVAAKEYITEVEKLANDPVISKELQPYFQKLLKIIK